MSKYVLTMAEREVQIRWDAVDHIAHIYTSDPVYIRRLDKRCAEHPDAYKCTKVDPLGYFKQYECPADRIWFAKPTSEARREAGKRASAHLPHNNR